MKIWFMSLVACLAGAFKTLVSSERQYMANAANAPTAKTHPTGNITFYADAAIATRYFLVKRGAGTTFGGTKEHVAVSAADSDRILGVCTDEAEAVDDPVNVQVFGSSVGTMLVVAAGVLAIDTEVCSNGDGKVKAAVSGKYILGRTLQAAGADGDVIEITPSSGTSLFV